MQVIRNATLPDGRTSDIGIAGDRIIALGTRMEGATVIDASGSIVLPGFIDVHSHTDESALRPSAFSKLLQGVTSEICGQCGGAPAPCTSSRGLRRRIKLEEDGWYPALYFGSFADFWKALACGAPCNQAVFAGWWALSDDGDPWRALDRALAEGAAGLSIHQESDSWKILDRDQRLALFSTASRAGAVVSLHLEGYDARLPALLNELFDLARRTGVRLQLSHMKVLGRAPVRDAVLEQLDSDPSVRFDVTPFTSICTRARSLVARTLEAGAGSMPYYEAFTTIRGLSRGWTITRGDFAKLARQIGEEPGEPVEASGLDEQDVISFLSHRRCFVGTDASAVPACTGVHRRAFDSFPKAISLLRSAGFGWPAIARKLASDPAEWFGLQGRGRIEVGAYADLVVLDERGIRGVVVNGKIAVEDGNVKDGFCGRPLPR
jgi:N-acyl-D-amino-acid deacylase